MPGTGQTLLGPRDPAWPGTGCMSSDPPRELPHKVAVRGEVTVREVHLGGSGVKGTSSGPHAEGMAYRCEPQQSLCSFSLQERCTQGVRGSCAMPQGPQRFKLRDVLQHLQWCGPGVGCLACAYWASSPLHARMLGNGQDRAEGSRLLLLGWTEFDEGLK